DRTPPGRGAHQRRDGAAVVHSPQQPVLEQQSERADGQSARRHLSVRAEPVQELAATRVDRGPVDHADHPRAEHHRAIRRFRAESGRKTMNTTSTVGVSTERPAATAAVAHPVKFEVKHLDFYYGQSQALKDVNLTLADR